MMRPFSYALAIVALASVTSVSLASPKVTKKVPPEFPAEAIKKGISTAVIRAKINVEADGKVSSVEILEADPKKIFDQAAISALMSWRFEPGEKGSFETKLVFKNED